MQKKHTNREKLLEYGLRVELVDKLNSEQLVDILSFAIDRHKSSELVKELTMAISMEVGNKPGAASLLASKIATVMQLKNITPEQIAEVSTEYNIHQDELSASKLVRDFIINNQQDKLEDKNSENVKYSNSVHENYLR